MVDEEQDVGSADADVVQAAVDPQGDRAGAVDAVGADAVVRVTGPVGSGRGLGPGVVDGRWGAPVRE